MNISEAKELFKELHPKEAEIISRFPNNFCDSYIEVKNAGIIWREFRDSLISSGELERD